MVWESDLGNALSLPDDACAQVSLGFEFEFFDNVYTQLWVNTNGNVTFDDCNINYITPDIPYGDPGRDHILIAALWGDFVGDVYVNTLGDEGDRRFVITWFQVHEYEGSTGPNSFQIQLFEGSNEIQLGYNGLSTNGINWKTGYPSDNQDMDVGIDSGTGSYINSASGSEIPPLDMSNICYYPGDSAYEEILGACSACPPEPYFLDESTFEKLEDLWLDSNPRSGAGENGLMQEREQGAWIVDLGNGQFDLVRSENSGKSCRRVPPIQSPNIDPPVSNSVAYIHTHPLPAGGIYQCLEPNGDVIGLEIRTTKPSVPDKRTAGKYPVMYPQFSHLKFYVIAINYGVYEYSETEDNGFAGCIEGFNE